MMKELIATVPAAGTNTILITHFPNVKAALGVQIGFGDAAIVKPDGDGHATVVVPRITAKEWAAFQAAADRVSARSLRCDSADFRGLRRLLARSCPASRLAGARGRDEQPGSCTASAAGLRQAHQPLRNPSGWRISEPVPAPSMSGTPASIAAAVVIRIGRKRSRQA